MREGTARKVSWRNEGGGGERLKSRGGAAIRWHCRIAEWGRDGICSGGGLSGELVSILDGGEGTEGEKTFCRRRDRE